MAENNEIRQDDAMDVDVASMVHQRQQQLQEQEAKKELSHGDYVEGKNGEAGGIVIDHEEVMRKETEFDGINHIKDYLSEMDQKIEMARSGQAIVDTNANQDFKTIENVPKSNQDAIEISKVAEAFANMEPTANGLAHKDSKEVQEYKEAMEKLASGETKLPSPEEIAKLNQEKKEKMVQESPAPVEKETPETSEENSDEKVVQFNVPEGRVEQFISTLNIESRKAIKQSKTIIVNEVKELKIPTVTRQIDSIKEFKRVVPHKYNYGINPAVLINSGYIAYFSGCGSLAMASLLPDEDGPTRDYAKRYQFCYDNLVDTSLGKLSFQEFCARTSLADISTCLYAILRGSDPDENEIQITCADCGHTYNVKYSLSALLDRESYTEEMMAEVDKIIAAKDIADKAKDVHEHSKVMTSKYAEIEYDDIRYIIECRAVNGISVIEREPLMAEFVKKYGQYTSIVLPYVPSIIVVATLEGETEESAYKVTDPEVIAKIISDLDDTAITALSQILDGVVEYSEPTYSFKGSYKCPKCGRLEENLQCKMDELVFYKVARATR